MPWKRRQGYATKALELLLPQAQTLGLEYVELTTDADNEPSQKVILANGGVFVRPFTKPDVHGGGDGHVYRIPLEHAG